MADEKKAPEAAEAAPVKSKAKKDVKNIKVKALRWVNTSLHGHFAPGQEFEIPEDLAEQLAECGDVDF